MKQTEHKISILISTYNKEKYIIKTLNSCIKQNYKNYEIIVADTGSNDGTKNFLKKFKNPLLKVIYLKKKFKYGALNQIYATREAFKVSSGEIICLLDGDDLFKKSKLDEINNFFSKNKNTNIVQDIPKIIKKNKKYDYILKRKIPTFINIWPKFYPTSTFSIRKKELKNFFKVDKGYKHTLLEIDARLFFYSKIVLQKHHILKKQLTYYKVNNEGISSKYKKFNQEWFLKRVQAHEFIRKFKRNKKYEYGFDYIISKYINKLIN